MYNWWVTKAESISAS